MSLIILYIFTFKKKKFLFLPYNGEIYKLQLMH